jgi:hypothetical protein
MNTVTRVAPLVATCLAAMIVLAGCGAAPTTGGATAIPAPTSSPAPTNVVAVPQDAAAFTQLAEVAPQSLKLEGGVVSSTVCWTPSQHLFNDLSVATAGTWKVLCRVFYDLKGKPRYQDATCIGDFDKAPMLDHCYVWELYSGEAHFEDGDRLATPAPTPLP